MPWQFPWKKADPEQVEVVGGTHDAFASVREQLASLAQNLITLEINTIIKENMVAGPMPTIHNALIEIASGYMKTFEYLGVDISPLWPPGPDPVPNPADAASLAGPEWQTIELKWSDQPTAIRFDVGYDQEFCFLDLFICLQRGARLAGRRYKGERPLSQDAVTVKRMEDNADKLRVILLGNKLGTDTVTRRQIRSREDVARPDPDLSISDRLTIKKIWEVASERVIAQTVIQLDGDVITRLASDFGNVQDVDKLLALHQQGLGTAISRWDSLMNAALAVIRGLAGAVKA